MSLQPSIKKNFILSTLYQILTVITPFITAPYLARVLGAEKIGISSYSYSIVTYFVMFSSLGTATYGIREISRTRENKQLNTKLFWEIEILSVITSSCMLCLWIILILFSPNYRIIFTILTFSILTTMLDISWFYNDLEEFKYTVTRNSIVKILGVILIILFVKKPSDLWIFIFINGITGFLGNLSMWITVRKFLVPINFKELKIIPHFKETFIYFIPTIASTIYQVLDKTLIGLITQKPSQVGYYEEATKIINLLKSFCYTSISNVLGTRNSFLFEQNNITEMKSNISKTIDFVLFMSIGACFGIIGISRLFIKFFLGNNFETSIFYLQLLSPTLIIVGISTVANNLYFIPAGLRKKSCFFEVCGAFVNLIFNLILIPHLSSIGAIIGTLIAESIISILYIFFSKGIITFTDLIKLSYKKIIAAFIMLLCISLIDKLKINDSLILILQIISSSFVYLIILLLLKDKNVFLLYRKLTNKFVKNHI